MSIFFIWSIASITRWAYLPLEDKTSRPRSRRPSPESIGRGCLPRQPRSISVPLCEGVNLNFEDGRLREDALLRADASLAVQPTQTKSEKGQLRDIHADSGEMSLTRQGGVGSSGRIRTYDPPVNSRMLYR
jgi:hypothetical protein